MAILLVLVGLLGSSAVRAAEPGKPDESFPEPRGTAYADVHTSTSRYVLHDVTRVNVHAEKGWLHVWVEFRLPLKLGMYEAVDLLVDCDGNQATGIYGADLYVRVSAGSRFRPNTEKKAPAGLLPAFETRTAGWAVPRPLDAASGGSHGLQWLWSGTDPVLRPRVRDKTYYFALPLQMLKEQGLRYNERIGLYLRVESVLAEQPVWLPYRCVDDGLEIRVDGLDDDWSGGPRVVDDVDELHPAAEGLDIRDLQVEHGKDALYARLRLAHPGFGLASVPPDGDDISVWDAITFAFEPLGGGSYMEYRTVTVPVRTPRLTADDTAWAVGDRLLETRIARPPAQTRFRVMAWSEARRMDRVPDSGWAYYDIPASAWGP